MARPVERCATGIVPCIDIGASLNEQAGDVGMRIYARCMKGPIAVNVLYIHIGSPVDEQTGDVGVAVIARLMKGYVAKAHRNSSGFIFAKKVHFVVLLDNIPRSVRGG